MKRSALAFVIAGIVACAGEKSEVVPQYVLYVDTDAPLPKASGARPSIDEPLPLFDRLRMEVIPAGTDVPCRGCTNEFAIDTELLRERRASIGIALPRGTPGHRVRVRMFLQSLVRADSEPDPDATIDVNVPLPPLGEGRQDLTVFLGTDIVGKPRTIEPSPGKLEASHVGSWEPATRVPCTTEPKEHEACVPGGAFWMGGASGPWAIVAEKDSFRPRLVVLSPFFLDKTEMTVKRFRPKNSTDFWAVPWSGKNDGSEVLDFCNFRADIAERDEHPLNCLPWSVARAFCRSEGGDLPTEAQFEYASGGMFHRTFVWGEDPPACTDATFSHGGYGVFGQVVSECRPPNPPGGTTVPGTGLRDRLVLPTGTIVDLAGNVSELVLDQWNRHDEPCWNEPGVLVDPLCNKRSSDGDFRTARGGDWFTGGGRLARHIRSRIIAGLFASPEVGFRCARRDR